MSGGQCYGCGAGFGLFKKEHGCKNCGFAFCTKCLTKKASVPKLNNTRHSVCNKCYDVLTGHTKPDDGPARFSPPEAYKKRVASLQESKSPTSKSVHHPRLAHASPERNAYRVMAKPDIEIAQRLVKLREKPKETKPPQTQAELEERLANLKGMDSSRYNATTKHSQQIYQPPDRRSQQEQVSDLLDEICSEVELDSQLSAPHQQTQNRLSQIQDDEENAALFGKDEYLENNLNIDANCPFKLYNKNVISLNKNGGTVKANYPTGNNRSSLDEVRCLIQQAAHELQVDAKQALLGLEKDKELQERLDKIKCKKKSLKSTDQHKVYSTGGDESSDDDEAAMSKLVQQLLEESRLDEEAGSSVATNSYNEPINKGFSKHNIVDAKHSNIPDEDADELPWCCICNETATIRCDDCDMDLYCEKCFKRGHKEFGIRDHKFCRYVPPKLDNL